MYSTRKRTRILEGLKRSHKVLGGFPTNVMVKIWKYLPYDDRKQLSATSLGFREQHMRVPLQSLRLATWESMLGVPPTTSVTVLQPFSNMNRAFKNMTRHVKELMMGVSATFVVPYISKDNKIEKLTCRCVFDFEQLFSRVQCLKELVVCMPQQSYFGNAWIPRRVPDSLEVIKASHVTDAVTFKTTFPHLRVFHCLGSCSFMSLCRGDDVAWTEV